MIVGLTQFYDIMKLRVSLNVDIVDRKCVLTFKPALPHQNHVFCLFHEILLFNQGLGTIQSLQWGQF